MSRRSDVKRNALNIIAVILICTLVISIMFIVLNQWEKGQKIYSEQEYEQLESKLEYNGEEYVLKNDIETLLVLGLDKYSSETEYDAYNNNRQADFLMLVVLDNANKTCKALQINRDTMTQMNVLGVAGQKIDTVTKQIALAHTYGNGGDVSCRNTADAVSQLLYGTKIDHYISLTMDSAPVFNDLVGGVEVTVLDDYKGIDDTLVQGQNVTLYGDHVLNYVRSRYGLEDSSNNARMVRQRQYLEALYEKTLKCIENDAEFIPNAALTMSEYIVSDRSVTQLEKTIEKCFDYTFEGISYIKGESILGEEFMEFYPDDDSLKANIIELFYAPKE